MCGITGILNLDGKPVSIRILKAMTAAIAHRGPDGDGHFQEGAVGLGHRRLAILDLTPAGDQPMISEDDRFVLTYNGEVYNFMQLRRELEAMGHRFRSRTDTEVVLTAYSCWGPECVERFNGMFAFAVWDRKHRELFLARDRYGIKPLYYTMLGNRFLFASEIKAILAHPAYCMDVDVEALLEYFTFQNFFSDKTLYSGIRMLPAGTWIKIPREEYAPSEFSEIHPQRYWDFDFREPDVPSSEGEYLEELDRLFCQAVERQTVSDVEIGAYLSGGIDSGSVTAVAAQRLPYIKTYTCGFDLHSASGLEFGFDEREKAEHMSYLFRTEHYEMVLKAGDMERCLPQVVWHQEEPRVGQCYPNYYIAQLAGRFVKVVLAGTGSDELFGGYPWRYYRAVVNGDFEDYIDKYYRYWQRLVPNRWIWKLFEPIRPAVRDVWTRDIFRNVFNGCIAPPRRPEDHVNNSLYFEAKTFLHGLLVVEDKLSMAHGLETRVPFLDNDLVDFAMTLPVRFKLGNLAEVVRLNENDPGPKTQKYFSKTKDGKLLLRKALGAHVPRHICTDIKQGFSGPDASWFKGESIDYLTRTLFDESARLYEFLDRATVRQLVEEHLSGKVNRRLFIWSLLFFEQWCKTFL